MDFDTRIKLQIYRTTSETTRVPTANEVAAALEVSPEQVEESFQRLAGQRLLVLEPGERGQIRMAPPFSGIATPFQVSVIGKVYYANCIWDALGVPAALHQDAEVRTRCAYSGEHMVLNVQSGGPLLLDCAIHFAVPAALWWEDIIYT